VNILPYNLIEKLALEKKREAKSIKNKYMNKDTRTRASTY